MRSTITLTLLFLSTFLLAQNYQLYFGGNHQFATEDTEVRQFVTSSIFLPTPPDTLYIRRYFDATSTTTTRFKTLPGFTLGLDADWDLTKKLSFRSGVGFVSTFFEIETESTFQLSDLTGRTDTLDGNPFTPIGTFGSTCTFTNTPADIGVVDQVPRYFMLALQIPVKLNYRFNEHMGLALGASLRTPVASNRHQERSQIEQVTDDLGDNYCTYYLDVQNDRTGSHFRDLTLSAEAEFYWWLSDVGLSVGGGKTFTNLMGNTAGSTFNSNNLQFRPYAVMFKVMYRLGKGEE